MLQLNFIGILKITSLPPGSASKVYIIKRDLLGGGWAFFKIKGMKLYPQEGVPTVALR